MRLSQVLPLLALLATSCGQANLGTPVVRQATAPVVSAQDMPHSNPMMQSEVANQVDKVERRYGYAITKAELDVRTIEPGVKYGFMGVERNLRATGSGDSWYVVEGVYYFNSRKVTIVDRLPLTTVRK